MSVTLGGRSFVVADLDRITFAQSHYLMGQVRAEGLDAVWPLEGESDIDYEQRLRSQIFAAANVPQMLAGYLLPEGQQWSAAIARDVANHFEGLTDPADQASLMALAGDVAPDFFVRALDWFAISQLYSSGVRPQPPALNSAH